MSRTNLPHIVVSNRKNTKPYQSVGRGGGQQKRPSIDNKSAHIQSRYILTIGLSTPDEEVDIYTPVSAQNEMSFDIEIET
ncbi:MAG: hypothetical protein JJU13_15015 [Balneolaceae bacterium]|nr:hypothetical protein [Balneolaceae bacterium]